MRVKQDGKHHRLGGSTTKRWFSCAYSVPASEKALAEGLIQTSESNFSADKGTAAHYLGEKCLTTGCSPIDYLGEKIYVGKNAFTVDAAFVEAVSIHVDFCRKKERRAEFKQVEFNSDLISLYDEDVGGPCDHVAIKRKHLYITDYKNGRWLVEVKDNTQLFLYALGCYLALKDKYEIAKVTVTITQPHGNHEDGPIRSQTISVRELMRFKTTQLDPAVQRVKEATVEVKKNVASPKHKPTPSDDACAWCPIEGICQARIKSNSTSLALVKNKVNLSPNMLTLEEAEQIVLYSKIYTDWINKVKAYYKTSLESGTIQSTSHKVVKSLGNRKWKNERRVKRKLKRLGLSADSMLLAPTLNGPAGIQLALQKELGMSTKDAKGFIENLTERNVSTVLAPIKDGREAIVSNPADDFAHLISNGE